MRLWDKEKFFITIKKSCPSYSNCWDRMKNQPAVPPGLTYEIRPLYAYYHMQTFDHGESCSVAHTLENPFLIALESPFGFMFLTVFPPSTALWRKIDKTYLLFFIGFLPLYAVKNELSIQMSQNIL